VRSFPQEEKTRKLDDKREERPCEQRSWGASFAKGLRTMGKKVLTCTLTYTLTCTLVQLLVRL
jgi:hypothetical protein